MYEVWDGDVFLYYIDTEDEVLIHTETGFVVKAVDLS